MAGEESHPLSCRGWIEGERVGEVVRGCWFAVTPLKGQKRGDGNEATHAGNWCMTYYCPGAPSNSNTSARIGSRTKELTCQFSTFHYRGVEQNEFSWHFKFKLFHI